MTIQQLQTELKSIAIDLLNRVSILNLDKVHAVRLYKNNKLVTVVKVSRDKVIFTNNLDEEDPDFTTMAITVLNIVDGTATFKYTSTTIDMVQNMNEVRDFITKNRDKIITALTESKVSQITELEKKAGEYRDLITKTEQEIRDIRALDYALNVT